MARGACDTSEQDEDMAHLYFRYGAMGSSKTANALMVAYNYREKGQRPLLAKPSLDVRDGANVMASRIGLSSECVSVEELVRMGDGDIKGYDCIIIDEAQFCTKDEISRLVEIVDDCDVPVIAYGLRTDFKRELFEGAKWLLAWADIIEEIKTVCWCGRAATCNARVGEDGRMVTEGGQIVLGANDRYTSLCRRHHRHGMLSRP